MYLFQRNTIIILVLIFAFGQVLFSNASFFPITIEDSTGDTSIFNVKKINFNGATISNDNNGQITVFVSDSDTLDSFDSSQFLRSDINTVFSNGVLTINPITALFIDGSFRYSDGSETNNYILTSNSNGMVYWVSPEIIFDMGDNLGDHKATTHLNMANNSITNISNISASIINSSVINLVPRTEPPSEANSGDIFHDASHAICVFMNGSWIKIAGTGRCAGGDLGNLGFPGITMYGNPLGSNLFLDSARQEWPVGMFGIKTSGNDEDGHYISFDFFHESSVPHEPVRFIRAQVRYSLSQLTNEEANDINFEMMLLGKSEWVEGAKYRFNIEEVVKVEMALYDSELVNQAMNINLCSIDWNDYILDDGDDSPEIFSEEVHLADITTCTDTILSPAHPAVLSRLLGHSNPIAPEAMTPFGVLAIKPMNNCLDPGPKSIWTFIHRNQPLVLGEDLYAGVAGYQEAIRFRPDCVDCACCPDPGLNENGICDHDDDDGDDDDDDDDDDGDDDDVCSCASEPNPEIEGITCNFSDCGGFEQPDCVPCGDNPCPSYCFDDLDDNECDPSNDPCYACYGDPCLAFEQDSYDYNECRYTYPACPNDGGGGGGGSVVNIFHEHNYKKCNYLANNLSFGIVSARLTLAFDYIALYNYSSFAYIEYWSVLNQDFFYDGLFIEVN
jgi:hypothetical protein